MTRYEVASIDAFPTDGTRVITELDGLEVAVFRIDGEYHALVNYCVHQGAPLCEGKLTGRMDVAADGVGWEYDDEKRCIVCPWHEWKFDVTTGKNVLDERYVTPTFEVEVEDGVVYVHR